MSSKFLKWGISVLVLATVWAAAVAILNFFGIGFAAYGSYLFWGVALALFYYVLQPNEPSLFADGKQS